MKTLLFAITLFSSAAFAGGYEFNGATSIGTCSMHRFQKSSIEIQKKTIRILEKAYDIATSEEKKQEYAEKIEKATARLKESIESFEYNHYMNTMSFVFTGDASYILKYPRTTMIEGVEFTNYTINTLGSQFINFVDDRYFETQIPGAWSVSVQVASGFICDHPANQDIDDIEQADIEHIALDFFIKN